MLRSVGLLAVVVSFALVSSGADEAGAGPAVGANGRIAFGFANGIGAVDPDGRRFQLVVRVDSPFDLKWSPRGHRLLYSAGGFVFSVRGNGTGRITVAPFHAEYDWAPDASMIVLSTSDPVAPEGPGIYVVKPDGAGLTRIIAQPPDEDFSAAAWSRQGRLAFIGNQEVDGCEDYRSQLYTAAPDGSDVVTLLDECTYWRLSPAWSPLGDSITFISFGPIGFVQLVSFGAGAHWGDCCVEDSVSWSPAGTQLAYVRYPDIDSEERVNVFTINADGSNRTRITTRTGISHEPFFSPDGRKLGYVSRGNLVIKTLAATTREIVDLRRQPLFGPDWQPRCTIIGTPDGDEVTGTAGRDHVCLGNGDDQAATNWRNDAIFGGNGNDALFGGGGDDVLNGGPGLDTLDGGPGRDFINARDGTGGDIVRGGSGEDVCLLDPGDVSASCRWASTR